MKTILLILLSVLTTEASQSSNYDWIACNTAGKEVPVARATGDIGTLPIPGPKSRPSYVAFFTTQVESAILGDLTGKTITATFHVDGAPAWGVGYGAGVATLRLYFTTTTGYYNLNNANAHPELYWYSYPLSFSMSSTDNSTITFSATLDPSQWLGGESNLTGFAFAVSHIAQIGFAFGGTQFFDTGINASTSTTFHLLSYTAQ